MNLALYSKLKEYVHLTKRKS